MNLYNLYFLFLLALSVRVYTAQIVFLEASLGLFTYNDTAQSSFKDTFLEELRHDLKTFPEAQYKHLSCIRDENFTRALDMLFDNTKKVLNYFGLEPIHWDQGRQGKDLRSEFIGMKLREGSSFHLPQRALHHSLFTIEKQLTQEYKDKLLKSFDDNLIKILPIDLKEEDKKLIEEAAMQYKIHLMPYKVDLPIVLYHLLREINKNSELRDNLSEVKFCLITPECSSQKDVPTIVLYTKNKTAGAQKVLDIIYQIFKHYRGSGVQPRFNVKVTDLIWWANGDGDLKYNIMERNKQLKDYPNYEYFFTKDKLTYRTDLTGGKIDYGLKGY